MFTMVKASEMYPKPQLIRDNNCRNDDNNTDPAVIPFTEVPGEAVIYIGETADTDGIIALSNYRLHISRSSNVQQQQQQPSNKGNNNCSTVSINIPLTCVEFVEQRDLFFMNVYCKDARFYLVQFMDNAACKEWVNRITYAIAPPSSVDQKFQVFAFVHHAWAREEKHHGDDYNSDNSVSSQSGDDAGQEGAVTSVTPPPPSASHMSNWFRADVARLRFDYPSVWRISTVNKDFKMCASYPPELLVPASISDQVLESVAKFRLAGRIPTIVWRHTGNGAVLARCSQPAVGWLGWRSSEDEELVNAIAEACAYDTGNNGSDDVDGSDNDSASVNGAFSHGGNTDDSNSTTSSGGNSDSGVNSAVPSLKDLSAEVAAARKAPNGELKKVLIIDARSYFVGIGNRTRGGGVEYPEYYPTSEIQFMGLCNIHEVRKSFQRLRTICSSPPVDHTTWLQLLDNTKWLHHLSGLLRTANLCAKALHYEARPVMVHCSDGWDRTPQIVALTELLLDPYYRSMEGFRVLVEKEWLDFGHKMADRCGLAFSSSDPNERCPIFLQFLDCVHQLLLQFPCDFEFNISYLFKLAQHTYSSLFGTFLCNSLNERRNHRVAEETRSVWDFLSSQPFNFCNLLYHPRNEVLWPKFEVRDLLLWQDVYVSEQGRGGGALVTGAAAFLPEVLTVGSAKGPRSGCVSSSEDSGANNSRDGSENGELQSQDISLVKQELERLQVNDSEPAATSWWAAINGSGGGDANTASLSTTTTAAATATNNVATTTVTTTTTTSNNCDEDVCGGCGEPNDRQSPIPATLSYARKNGAGRHIETSTDTLVADGDVEERLRARSSTLVAQDADASNRIDKNNEKTFNGTTVTSSKNQKTSRKVNGSTLSEKVKSSRSTKTVASALPAAAGNERRNKCDVPRRMGGHHRVRPILDLAGGCARLARPWEVPAAAQERADAYFKNRFDSDGLPVHQTEAQRRLVAIYFTHLDEVEALQRDLHLTRMALCKQKASTCRCGGTKGTDASAMSQLRLTDGMTGNGGDASSTSTAASETSSTWENVDERETKPTLWVPDHAAVECMCCQTSFWFGRRKHHCRSCGNLVCGECSLNSLPLPAEQLYHPVRVCDACFQRLKPDEDEEETEAVNAPTSMMTSTTTTTSGGGEEVVDDDDIIETAEEALLCTDDVIAVPQQPVD